MKCQPKKAKKLFRYRDKVLRKKSRHVKNLDKILKNEDFMKFEQYTSQFGINEMGEIGKKIEVMPESMVKEVLSMYMYTMIGNYGRTNAIIRNSLKKFYLYRNYSFYHGHNISISELDQSIIFLLSKINEKTNDKELLKLYLRHHSQAEGVKFDFEIVSRFNLLLNSSDISSAMQSPLYGFRYPALWYPVIVEKNGANVASKFLKKSYPVWQQNIKDNIWLYKFVRPADEKRRVQVTKVLREMFKSESPWIKEAQFWLLDDIDFKVFFEKYSGKKSRPLFVQKKNYYQKQLMKDVGLEYSIYNLLTLGARPLDFLLDEKI
jgi:hypothetical protein